MLIGQTFRPGSKRPLGFRIVHRGVLGLLGMLMVYMAWFKQTFGVYGVAQPLIGGSIRSVLGCMVVFGLTCLVATRILRLIGENVVPEPAGLLLTLVGMPALFNGMYVWLITQGPLMEEE